MITNTNSVATVQCNNTDQYIPGGSFRELPYPFYQKNRDKTPDLSKSNLFVSLQTKSYVPVTGCLFEHIISTAELSYAEKLFFLLGNSLAIINFRKKGQRAVALPASSWAAMLGCSRSLIFAMQKSLVQKSYFNIVKNKNFHDQNQRNLITPVLPTQVAAALSSYPNRVGALAQSIHGALNTDVEDQAEHLLSLDQSKLFIPLNYHLLKLLCQDRILSPLEKIIWLDLYAYSFKTANNHRKEEGLFVINSYQNLAQKYGCNISALSRAMTALQKQGFITRDRFLLKHSASLEERKDKVLWRLAVSLPPNKRDLLDKTAERSTIFLPSGLPDDPANSTKPARLSGHENNIGTNSIDRNHDESTEYDEYEESEVKKSIKLNELSEIPVYQGHISDKDDENDAQIASDDPDIANSGQYINKNLKAKDNRNIRSNFRDTAKVILNNFRDKFKKKTQPFNIRTELIRQKLRTLSKEKADKARKFAYSLCSKKLAKGYASTIGKHELAKQLIFHAATWIPDKLGKLSRDQEIDTALAVAWKNITGGNWQEPLEWAKANILQQEYECHYRKYHQQGVLSAELGTLERETRNLLNSYVSLESEIKNGAGAKDKDSKGNSLVLLQTDIDTEVKDKDAEDKDTEERYQYVNGYQLMPEFKEEYEHYGYEERRAPLYQYDISDLSVEQRQLKMTTSETSNMVSIETSAHLVHYFELKMIECSDDGEMVMTLKPSGGNKFLGLTTPDIKKEIPDMNMNNKQSGETKFQTMQLTSEEESIAIDKLLMTENSKCIRG